jgi:AcrR family transcriptional regulator
LLAATVRAVARDGPRGLNYRKLAKAAGVAHSLVHYHFGSSEKLLAEARDWAIHRVIELMHVQPRHDWLKEYGDSLAEIAPADLELHIFMSTLALDAVRHVEQRAQLTRVFDEIFSSIQTALRAEGIVPNRALSRIVAATMIGLTMQQQILNEPENTRRSVAALRQLLNVVKSSSNA